MTIILVGIVGFIVMGFVSKHYHDSAPLRDHTRHVLFGRFLNFIAGAINSENGAFSISSPR
jgi:hypothetical protein